ncbi:MAG: hypothetical protein RLZZ502_1872 [Pseudomonadota bacterium]
MKKAIWLLPLLLFVGLAVFLLQGLSKKPNDLPSPLLNKPAPEFVLPVLNQAGKQFSNKDYLGQVWLFNVWGSWCPSCLTEHPVLNRLAAKKVLPVVGLNWRDKDELALAWLAKYGNPYTLSVTDQSQTAINYGVYGAPETFVIDKKGVLRHKVVGPLTDELVQEKLLPLIARLKTE